MVLLEAPRRTHNGYFVPVNEIISWHEECYNPIFRSANAPLGGGAAHLKGRPAFSLDFSFAKYATSK
jgi:hypothetical protein